MTLEQQTFPKETPHFREVLWTSVKYAYGLFVLFYQSSFRHTDTDYVFPSGMPGIVNSDYYLMSGKLLQMHQALI